MNLHKINHPVGNLRVGIIKNIAFFLEWILFKFLSIFLKLKVKENQIVISRSIYAPWKKDKQFISIYDKIKHLTLLDIVRLYTLWNASKQVKKKNGIILDIGCLLGGVGYLVSKNNKQTTYLIDSFSGYKDNDEFFKKQKLFFTNLNLVKDNTKQLGLKKIKILKGYFPYDFKNKFKKSKIKLCHLDINTYKSTKDSFAFVKDNIVKGGYIIFDDYGTYGAKGIINLVDDLKKKYSSDFIFFNNFYGQMLLIKK